MGAMQQRAQHSEPQRWRSESSGGPSGGAGKARTGSWNKDVYVIPSLLSIVFVYLFSFVKHVYVKAKPLLTVLHP